MMFPWSNIYYIGPSSVYKGLPFTCFILQTAHRPLTAMHTRSNRSDSHPTGHMKCGFEAPFNSIPGKRVDVAVARTPLQGVSSMYSLPAVCRAEFCLTRVNTRGL